MHVFTTVIAGPGRGLVIAPSCTQPHRRRHCNASHHKKWCLIILSLCHRRRLFVITQCDGCIQSTRSGVERHSGHGLVTLLSHASTETPAIGLHSPAVTLRARRLRAAQLFHPTRIRTGQRQLTSRSNRTGATSRSHSHRSYSVVWAHLQSTQADDLVVTMAECETGDIDVLEALLERDDSYPPWGFELRGGTDFRQPLSITRVGVAEIKTGSGVIVPVL